MEQLRIDTGRVRECADALGVLRSELDACEDIAHEAADAVGDSRLAGVVEKFGTDWSQHRKEISSSLDALQQTALQIASELEQVESHLTQVAAGGAQP
jgi:hypothetical protein